MSAISTILSGFSAFLSARVFIPKSIQEERNLTEPDQLPTCVKQTIASLLRDLGYHAPATNAERRFSLEESLRSDFSAYGGGQAWFETVCVQAAAMAELSYFGHSYEVQRQIARFTWFMIYIDDLCHKFPLSMKSFQHGMITRGYVEEPILEYFRNHLADMYRFWDSIPANCITTSAMEYISGCSLEEMPSIRNMVLSNTAQGWPYYLRTKTGVAAAYAFMIFPKDNHPDLSVYIQVIGDISKFIDLTNDVLSFYKERLAGEEHNYIRNRAFVNGKSIEETLRDVAQDVLAAHSRVTKTLQLSDGPTPWKNFVNGYLAFHVTQARYQLADLGF